MGEELAKRVELPRETEQSARLFHRMAKCYYQMGAFAISRDSCEESIVAAQEGDHPTYLLHSTMLLAVCQSKLAEFANAKENFHKALDLAKKMGDERTALQVEEALSELDSMPDEAKAAALQRVKEQAIKKKEEEEARKKREEEEAKRKKEEEDAKRKKE